MLCAGQLYGMEVPQKGPDYITILPKELKQEIIVLLTTSDTLEEAIEAVRALTETNKELNAIVNNPITTRTLVRIMAQKFTAPSEYIAMKLSTQGSANYRALSLDLMNTLWQEDFVQAEDLVNEGADIDFQTADTYPMLCEANDILNTDAIFHLGILTTALPIAISIQGLIASKQDTLPELKSLQNNDFLKDKIQSLVQKNQADLENAQAKLKEIKSLISNAIQRTKILLTDTQINQLSAKIDEDHFQEALDIIKQAKKYNGIIGYFPNNTNTYIFGANFSLVMYAIASDQLSILEWLINHKANLNVTMGTGDTALLMAISMGKKKTIELLLYNGADINQQNTLNKETRDEINRIIIEKSNVAKINYYYDTALYNSLDNETLKLIMFYGLTMPGQTPVIRLLNEINEFAEEEFNALLTLFLSKGANLNMQTMYGDSALRLLTTIEHDGFAKMMKLLLDHGADPSIKNNYDKTALDYSKEEDEEEDHERDEKIQLLEDAMKKQQKK